MTKTWSSPSGSRWEPVTQEGSEADGSDDPTPSPRTDPEGRRRRRQPVLVALVALLSLGTAGGAAYELAARTPTAGSSVGQRAADRDAGADGPAAGPAYGPGQDGHHRGRRGADGTRS